MTLKTKCTSKFKPWKEKILPKVKGKITEIKQKIKPKQTKSGLSDPDIKKRLKRSHHLLLSPLIKHQTILQFSVENTTFSSY